MRKRKMEKKNTGNETDVRTRSHHNKETEDFALLFLSMYPRGKLLNIIEKY